MSTKNIKEVIKGSEYDFLRSDKRLGDKIFLLCYGGSYAYGLNGPDSDIDIRGGFLPTKEDFLATVTRPKFEQFLDGETDTCIYEVNKFLELLSKANPNTIEMLGCLPEHYAYISDVGQLILSNKDLFITKQTYFTFSGYALSQLTRLRRRLVADATNFEKLVHTILAIKNLYLRLELCYPTFHRNDLTFYIVDDRDDSIRIKETDHVFNRLFLPKEELEETLGKGNFENCHIVFDINMKSVTKNDFNKVINEINGVLSSFSSSTGHRNNKKNLRGEDKQASHLMRLVYTSRDILQKGEINTYCGEYIEELLDIKNGKYRQADGRYNPDFFTKADEWFDKMKTWYDESKLPDNINMNKLEELNIQINEMVISKF